MTYTVQYLTSYGWNWEDWSRSEDLGVAMAEARCSAFVNQIVFRVIDEGGSVLYQCTPNGYGPDHSVRDKLRWQEVGF